MPDLNKFGIPVIAPNTAQDVDPWSAEEAVKASLPALDSIKKTDYLGYRACGFSVREAAALTGVAFKVIRKWREVDPEFKSWETDRLGDLQSRVGDTILRHQFMRNMHLVLKIDGDALRQVAFQRDKKDIPETVMDWAREAARRYKSQDLALMMKAISPDASEQGAGVNFNVFLNGEQLSDDAAKRAGVRQLLERFTYNHQQVIEGELVESDP